MLHYFPVLKREVLLSLYKSILIYLLFEIEDHYNEGHKQQQLTEILGFRTLSIVLVVEKQTKKQHDVSETGSVSVLR
jgi:hypothetical protein